MSTKDNSGDCGGARLNTLSMPAAVPADGAAGEQAMSSGCEAWKRSEQKPIGEPAAAAESAANDKVSEFGPSEWL